MNSYMRSICKGGRLRGAAVTVSLPPGDLVIADEDGIVVPRGKAAETLANSEAREKKEVANRRRFAVREPGLDVYDMRDGPASKGLVCRDDAEPHGRT